MKGFVSELLLGAELKLAKATPADWLDHIEMIGDEQSVRDLKFQMSSEAKIHAKVIESLHDQIVPMRAELQ